MLLWCSWLRREPPTYYPKSFEQQDTEQLSYNTGASCTTGGLSPEINETKTQVYTLYTQQ